MHIYFLPGQGADERLFKNMPLDNRYQLSFITYPRPEPKTSLAEYAKLISKQIISEETHVLIGTSLGGMLATELAEFTQPSKVILISSAKNRNELPFGLRFQKWFPFYKIIPAQLIKYGAKMVQPLFEPDRNNEVSTFKAMLNDKDPLFLKRTIGMMANWNRKVSPKNYIHIHGDQDNTLPIRNINYDFKIKGGSHMMTLTRGKEINDLILSLLSNCGDINC